MKNKLIASLAALVLSTMFVFADEANVVYRPAILDVCLFSPLQLPPHAARDVYGIRWNILYGETRSVYGLDLGLVGQVFDGNVGGLQLNTFNLIDLDFTGVQFGFLGNFVSKNVTGFQCGSVINWNGGDTIGFQLGMMNFDQTFTGMQFGIFNWTIAGFEGYQNGVFNISKNDFTGVGIGFSNYCEGNLKGVQIGVMNMAFANSRGLQLGVINAADNHTGLQIGVINMNAHGAMQVLPIINANFP